MSNSHNTRAASGSGQDGPNRALLFGGGLAVVVVAALVIAVLFVGGDNDDDDAGTASDNDAIESPTSPDEETDPVEGETDPVEGESSAPSQGPGEVGAVEILGDPLPVLDREAATDVAVGTPAPGFIAPDFAGTEHTVQPGDGTAKVIGFFTHWCSHCQAELPRLTDWLANNDTPEGVEVIAVSTAVDEGAPNFPPSTWFEAEDWPALVVRDSANSAIAAAYGLSGFPYFVVVGADGNVVARVSGELEVAEWEALLAQAASVSA